MDELNQRKLFQDIDRRVLLIVTAGILLSLLFFTLALAKRPGVQSEQTGSPALNLNKNLGFTVLKGSPRSNPNAQVSAPLISGQNCANTARYWLENPGNWPTDNLVVGQFTFRKDSILAIFQTEAHDEVTRVQQQFLAAALNILQGANTGKIEALMVESSAWLNNHPAKIELTDEEKAHGAELADRLASFNRGLTGPGICPGNPTESSAIALSTPILLPEGPVMRSATGSPAMVLQPDQEKKKPRSRRESQPEPVSPAGLTPGLNQPVSSVAPANPPIAEVAFIPQAPVPEPDVSDPGVSQDPSRPTYKPPSQGQVTHPKESKKTKEKKNPKHPPNEQRASSPAPSELAGQPTPPPQIGSGDAPGSTNPGNPGNGPGNGNGNGNGNGGGNGNGHGNGGGNGKGHGKKH